LLEPVRDAVGETGRRIGFKPAGGIRQAKQAIQHLVLVHETLGPDWLTPELYRIGASSLLNDILMQLRKEKTGAYQSPDYFTVDLARQEAERRPGSRRLDVRARAGVARHRPPAAALRTLPRRPMAPARGAVPTR